MSRKNFRVNRKERVFDILNAVFLCLFTLLCIYPFYYMLCYAFSDSTMANQGITLYPRGFTLHNFVEVFRLKSLPRAFMVSVFRTFAGCGVTLACCSFFAYIVSRREMYFQKLIYRFTVITMYVSGGLIPTYLVFRAYGLRNTLWVYLLPGAVNAYYVILMKTFMEQMPDSLEEAATIDGAGIVTCFLRVVLPLSKPILATIAVFTMVGQWNSWFDAHIYMTKTQYYPLQYVLYNFLQEAQRAAAAMQESGEASGLALTPNSVRMTITAISTLPILFVYPFMQRYFVKGLMIGAVKG